MIYHATRRRLLLRFRLWARRMRLGRALAFALVAMAVASGLATFATMTGETAVIGPDPKNVLILLYVDAIVLLLLGAVVARRLVSIWSRRRRSMAGAGLHIRIVVLFGLVAVTPAILVATFAALFLNFGVEFWFSDTVGTAIEESSAVARAYLHEHQQTIRADASAVANDIDREATNLMYNWRTFADFVNAQAAFRSLPEVMVFESSGRVLARSEFSLALQFDIIPDNVIDEASQGEVVVLTNDQDNRVRAVVKLNRFVDAYLLIGRFVEPRVLDHIDVTEKAVVGYKSLEKRRKGIQINFVLIFAVVAVLLLLAAVWLGMTLATQIVEPISDLIRAADRVRKGDLSVRVEAAATSDEVGTLGRAFNRMTDQIETQQQGLIEANRELDERRRFTETVLAGVSAGVIGLDGFGRINLPNRSASMLLGTDLDSAVGRQLGTVVPEMAEIVVEALRRPDRTQQAEIRLTRDGTQRTLLVRVASESLGAEVIGFVATFDDITELLSAQRKAAWADVARRIAHEIKNPLTPIQLSAERLRRKYLKQITQDPETFTTCTETIIRQVEDIGRMVDEFSSFARMPQAALKLENMSEICRQSVFLERNRHPEIEYAIELPVEAVKLRCDNRQVSQALTNLLKNAAESITSREGEGHSKGRIGLSVVTGEGGNRGPCVTVVVEDNGRGLPGEQRDRLTEPYVTTREKGTGLGLAIVKKIMEDHEGDLLLEDREEGGARVSLVFPIPNDAGPDQSGEADDPMKLATRVLH